MDEPVSSSAALDPPRFALRRGRLVLAGDYLCTLAATLYQRLAADPRSVMRQPTMRFWRIEELKNEIRAGALGPSDYLRYLLATGAMVFAAPFLAPEPRNSWDVAIVAVDLFFFMVGTIICFRAYGDSTEREFLGPYFAIGWVLSIRLIAILVLPAGLLYGMQEMYSAAGIPTYSTPMDLAVTLIWNFVFYVRLVSHFRTLAAA